MIRKNDDLWYALSYNPPDTFAVDDIKDIVAEIPGENDELNWWWILKLKTKKFVLLSGWCDCTGWDCQSGIDEIGIFKTALQAAKSSPVKEEYSKRLIRKNLMGQIKGIYPKFTYWENKE